MNSQQHIQNILNAQDLWEWNGQGYTYNTEAAAQRINAWVAELALMEPAACNHAATTKPNRQRRPRMTDLRLQRVADIYNASPINGMDAVANAFGKAPATAARYIAQARDAGMIEDRRRNKP